MTFRSVSVRDTDLLLEWRSRDEHGAWYEGQPTGRDEHRRWIQDRLGTHLVRIRIWQEDGRDVGMVRLDSNDELAFYAESDEIAARMLAELTKQAANTDCRVKATVDADDPKVAVLEQAGFKAYPAVFLVYKPSPLKNEPTEDAA